MGPRQADKSTLLHELVKTTDRKSIFLDCDEPDIRQILTNTTSTALKNLIGEATSNSSGTPSAACLFQNRF
jgi:predicted AAA+ superfamily ATPase